MFMREAHHFEEGEFCVFFVNPRDGAKVPISMHPSERKADYKIHLLNGGTMSWKEFEASCERSELAVQTVPKGEQEPAEDLERAAAIRHISNLYPPDSSYPGTATVALEDLIKAIAIEWRSLPVQVLQTLAQLQLQREGGAS